MNTAKAKVAEAFAASKVIAIIRGMEPDVAVKLAEAYCRGELHDNGLLELYAHVPHDELPEAL